MDCPGYEIRRCTPELLPQVAALLQHLTGDDRRDNLEYLQWKYVNNPCAGAPLGIVARQGDSVVGFRGYLATRWETGEGAPPVMMLCPGDTCVHPSHRRKGLSVAMGNLAMAEYARDYQFLVNFTCTKSSLPGYQKMGFVPLVSKAFVTRCGPLALARYVRSSKRTADLREAAIPWGQDGDLEISDRPRPKEMSSVLAAQTPEIRRISPHQDEDYFRWRFQNPLGRYVFYYLIDGDQLAAYVVIGVAPNNLRGYLLDCAGVDAASIQKILHELVERRHFEVLSVYHFCVDDTLSQLLSALGFKRRSLFRLLERRVTGELPVMIRPVREQSTEREWIVNGLDVRDAGNWAMKGICSDDA